MLACTIQECMHACVGNVAKTVEPNQRIICVGLYVSHRLVCVCVCGCIGSARALAVPTVPDGVPAARLL